MLHLKVTVFRRCSKLVFVSFVIFKYIRNEFVKFKLQLICGKHNENKKLPITLMQKKNLKNFQTLK